MSNNKLPWKLNGDLAVACLAAKKIIGGGVVTDRGQRRSRFTFDPTTGALVVSPDLDLKIRKALSREVRRIKVSLFLRQFRLKIEYLTLKARCTLLRMRRYLLSDFINSRRRRLHDIRS